MEELLIILGVIGLLAFGYAIWRGRKNRDTFGRIMVGSLGTPFYIEPWIYYLLAIVSFGFLSVIIAIGLIS